MVTAHSHSTRTVHIKQGHFARSAPSARVPSSLCPLPGMLHCRAIGSQKKETHFFMSLTFQAAANT